MSAWMELGAEPVLPASGWIPGEVEATRLEHRDVVLFEFRCLNGIRVRGTLAGETARLPNGRAYRIEKMRQAFGRALNEWERCGREDRDL
jgi:hypothetical protein